MNSPELPRRIIDDAARLVAYFKNHAHRVYGEMGGQADDGGEHVRALLKWIIRGGLAEFRERDISRNFDRFKHDPATLTHALGRLIDRNMIRPAPEPETHKVGRKRSPTYQVNPDLHSSPRFRRFRRNGSA